MHRAITWASLNMVVYLTLVVVVPFLLSIGKLLIFLLGEWLQRLIIQTLPLNKMLLLWLCKKTNLQTTVSFCLKILIRNIHHHLLSGKT